LAGPGQLIYTEYAPATLGECSGDGGADNACADNDGIVMVLHGGYGQAIKLMVACSEQPHSQVTVYRPNADL
jgi:hypothetical protein